MGGFIGALVVAIDDFIKDADTETQVLAEAVLCWVEGNQAPLVDWVNNEVDLPLLSEKKEAELIEGVLSLVIENVKKLI